MSCRCHSSTLYASLIVCPQCGHTSYDEGVGCERRACGYQPERGTTPRPQTGGRS